MENHYQMRKHVESKSTIFHKKWSSQNIGSKNDATFEQESQKQRNLHFKSSTQLFLDFESTQDISALPKLVTPQSLHQSSFFNSSKPMLNATNSFRSWGNTSRQFLGPQSPESQHQDSIINLRSTYNLQHQSPRLNAEQVRALSLSRNLESAARPEHEHFHAINKKMSRFRNIETPEKLSQHDLRDSEHSFSIPDQVVDRQRYDNYAHLVKKSLDMQLLPLKMNIINEYVSKSIKLSGYRLGNKYASVLGEVLREESQKFRQKIYLEQNNLKGDEPGFDLLLGALPAKTRKLELGRNKIGVQGARIISKNIQDNKNFFHLNCLNLRRTGLGDLGSIQILQNLGSLKNIQKINLAENQISDRAAPALHEAVRSIPTLREFYLSWVSASPPNNSTDI